MGRATSRLKTEPPVQFPREVHEEEVSDQKERQKLLELSARTETVLQEMKSLLQEKERRSKSGHKSRKSLIAKPPGTES